MRVALVANSRSGSEDRAEQVRGLLGERVVEVLEPQSLCDGPEAIDEAKLAAAAERLGGRSGSGDGERGGSGEAGGIDRVVVAGGDGSVGTAAALAARLGVPLAVIPAGTANDFARFLGVPLDVEAAAKLAGDPAARTRTVELAVAGGRRPFVNAATAGLSVHAARAAHPLKARLGKLAYAAGALKAGATGKPLHVTVRCDGDVAFRGDAWQVVVAATGAFGGGSGTGGVRTADHELDVAIVEAGSRLKLVRRAWAMRNQRLVDDPGVRHVRGRVVEVEGARTFNVDGEVLRPEPRFTIDGTFEVVAP